MRNDPASTATALLTRVGGPADSTAVAHCMTRLRLPLADPAAVDEEGLRALPGVLGLVSDGPACQIVLGPGAVDEITAEAEARVTAGRQAVDGPELKKAKLLATAA
ncbi:PTS glucose/sucrose transporter subunit IIB [Streptomyces sp. NPDC003233]